MKHREYRREEMISLGERKIRRAVMLIATTLVSKAFAENTAAQEIIDACSAAVVLSTLADELESRITAHNNNLKALQAAPAKAAAAAISESSGTAVKLAGPICLTLTDAEKKLVAAIQQQKVIIAQALKLAANISGQENIIARMAEIEVEDNQYGDAAPGDAEAGQTAIRLKPLNTKQPADCMAKPNDKVPSYKKLLSEQALAEINLFNLQAEQQPSGKDAAPLVGTAVGGTCTKGNANRAISGSSNNGCTIGGKLLKTIKAELLASKDGKYDEAETGNAESGDIDNNNKIAATEILAAAKALTKGPANFDPQALDSYSGSDTFRKAVGLIYGGILPDKPAPTDTERINQLIKEHYGEPSNFKNKFWGEVDKIKLPETLLGTKAGGTLANVDTLETAAKLTLQVQLLTEANKGQNAPGVKPKTETQPAAEEDKTEEKKDGDNKTNATECTATEEGKCDKEKCTWDKEKKECKVKEGTVIISTVIKAPVLLASFVLL
ncbi:variant surface protein (VSG), putative [Trypanosoma equiperdum]|uniref:Variant surface protein (VSG), putative n=1 Tax=Trypanosoma equiperdum TaxID=5694 RepID=A0A1G4IFX6_TRYEQ|nr:variant surface protein (VSG), putative [Trypanosoma equiperdum]